MLCMVWIISAVAVFLFPVTANAAADTGSTASGGAPAAPDVSAQAAVLLDQRTGQVLYQKNPHTHLAMASTTKIMTALLLIESGNPQAEITVTEPMTQVEGTSMGLQPGDQVTKLGLVYGMLLASGNDAATAAAFAVSGSLSAFADKMNARAAQLGMKDTHFVTPSGLDATDHYSTAYDMALLGAAAMNNPVFAQAASSKSATISYGNPPAAHTLTNHNRLLSMYDGVCGIKTGYTKKAGRCLVTCCIQDGVPLIAVTLNDPNDWDDHEALYDYGFSLLSAVTLRESLSGVTVPVAGSDTASVSVTAEEVSLRLTEEEKAELQTKVELPRFLYAPVHKGDTVGSVVYTLGGQTLMTAKIVSAGDAAYAASPPKLRESVADWVRSLITDMT